MRNLRQSRFYRFSRTRIYENGSGFLPDKSCNFGSKAARDIHDYEIFSNAILLGRPTPAYLYGHETVVSGKPWFNQL